LTRGAWLLTLGALVGGLLGACEASSRQLLKAPEEQAALRALQTRAFDTTDEADVLRNVIATLQDLGFVLDYANTPLGIVSATKLEGGSARVTVTAKRQGEKRTAVRANLQVGSTTVIDPLTYQEFFAALSKGMFLTAHAVE
jgi:predicted RNA-binding protein with EMAP domain